VGYIQGRIQPGARGAKSPLKNNSLPLRKSDHLAFKIMIKKGKILKTKS